MYMYIGYSHYNNVNYISQQLCSIYKNNLYDFSQLYTLMKENNLSSSTSCFLCTLVELQQQCVIQHLNSFLSGPNIFLSGIDCKLT